MQNTTRIVDSRHSFPTEHRRVIPSAPLRDIVESIWVQQNFDGSSNSRPSCVVPTGTVEILFQYGDLIGHHETGGFRQMPRSYVTGQRSRPVMVSGTGRTGLILVSLYPWGLRTLFPGSLEAPDGYTDLGLLSHAGAVRSIEEALCLAQTTRTRIELVENFLLRIRKDSPDWRVAQAARLLTTAGPNETLPQIARRLGMSERHLARSFKAGIGLQPGVFMRVMRFQRAMRLRRNKSMPWADVAASCGYSDQSHLVHEVRRFTGRSPGRIDLDNRPSTSPFNGDGASKFFDTVYLS